MTRHPDFPAAWRTERTRIADVRSEEAESLAAAFNDCSDTAELDPTFRPVDAAEVRALIEESERRAPGARGFRMQSIRLHDGVEPAGYFHFREDAPRPGVIALTIFLIRPGHRSSGLGREVAAGLLRLWAENSANRRAWARVYLSNRPALRFWTGLGFVTIVEHKGAFVHETEPGHASIILERTLGSETRA